MSTRVCLSADALDYPKGGGHLWVYLNWALGLRALGCEVIWLEAISPTLSADELRTWVAALTGYLKHYGLEASLALCSRKDEPLPEALLSGCLDLDAAAEADLLLNQRYGVRADVVSRFRRSALLDIDPGLLQTWMSAGDLKVARHDVYFTIGETVGRSGARFPDAGIEWHYTPPCVSLDCWQPHPVAADAPFTTLSHWYSDEWLADADGPFANDKRSGFQPFLDLPRHTAQPLELALCLAANEEGERRDLERRGWRVRDAWHVAATPWDYQAYIWGSRGEFSCAKPSCMRLQNAWISDRTLCYLASGKPAVVQHTGPSRFLPDGAGLFRFRDLPEAVRCLETASADYQHQCRLARGLAEEYFDARRVVRRVLERALA